MDSANMMNYTQSEVYQHYSCHVQPNRLAIWLHVTRINLDLVKRYGGMEDRSIISVDTEKERD